MSGGPPQRRPEPRKGTAARKDDEEALDDPGDDGDSRYNRGSRAIISTTTVAVSAATSATPNMAFRTSNGAGTSFPLSRVAGAVRRPFFFLSPVRGASAGAAAVRVACLA